MAYFKIKWQVFLNSHEYEQFPHLADSDWSTHNFTWYRECVWHGMYLVQMKCNILSNTFNIKKLKKAQKDKESQGHFLTFDLLSGIVVLYDAAEQLFSLLGSWSGVCPIQSPSSITSKMTLYMFHITQSCPSTLVLYQVPSIIYR